MSEPFERIIRTGESEYRKRFRTGIWVPITVSPMLGTASVLWFFATDDIWFPLSYAIVAMYAVLIMWVSRAYYASWKAEEAKLNLVLLLLVDAAPEDSEDDEPEH